MAKGALAEHLDGPPTAPFLVISSIGFKVLGFGLLGAVAGA